MQRHSARRIRRLMSSGRLVVARPTSGMSRINSPRPLGREDAGSPRAAFTSSSSFRERFLSLTAVLALRQDSDPLFRLGGPCPCGRRGHESGHLRPTVFDQGPDFVKIRFEQLGINPEITPATELHSTAQSVYRSPGPLRIFGCPVSIANSPVCDHHALEIVWSLIFRRVRPVKFDNSFESLSFDRSGSAPNCHTVIECMANIQVGNTLTLFAEHSRSIRAFSQSHVRQSQSVLGFTTITVRDTLLMKNLFQ